VRKPIELEMAHSVEKYGVQAIFGRPLFLHEIKEMNIAENVYNGYQARKASGNLAEWTTKNQDIAAILSGLEKEYAQY